MTYAISDLHGRYDLYLEMKERIRFSPEDTLYILGDVADRNKGGIQIFKDILQRVNISMLMGNHERMMLRALQDPEGISLNGHESNKELWYRNGGRNNGKRIPRRTGTGSAQNAGLSGRTSSEYSCCS